jgi:hypothetical protein
VNTTGSEGRVPPFPLRRIATIYSLFTDCREWIQS